MDVESRGIPHSYYSPTVTGTEPLLLYSIDRLLQEQAKLRI